MEKVKIRHIIYKDNKPYIKIVKKFGTGGHIILPKRFINRKVKIVILK